MYMVNKDFLAAYEINFSDDKDDNEAPWDVPYSMTSWTIVDPKGKRRRLAVPTAFLGEQLQQAVGRQTGKDVHEFCLASHTRTLLLAWDARAQFPAGTTLWMRPVAPTSTKRDAW